MSGIDVKRVRLMRGLRRTEQRLSVPDIGEAIAVGSAAVLGTDTPGVRPNFKVKAGVQVRVGDCLFVDRADTAVRYVSPIAGHVVSTEYGPRRTLSSVIVKADAGAEIEQLDASAPLDVGDGTAIREALLNFGLWPAFRARPFGCVPPSSATPRAIVVSAVNAGFGAPDPTTIVSERQADFDAGLQAIAALSEGTSDVPIFVCQSGAKPLAADGGPARMQTVQFVGSHMAALPSTHVYQLAPARIDAPLWTIGYQDVLAIGTLVLHGHYDPMRVVAVGPSSKIVSTVLGANLRALIGGSVADHAQSQTQSGSLLAARPATFLGRYDTQVSVQPARPARKPNRFLPSLTKRHTRSPLPLIPNRTMDAVLPANVLAVPLMRALAVGDVEAALRLGALDLVEEDVAPLNHICPSGADYCPLLRSALDTIAQDYA